MFPIHAQLTHPESGYAIDKTKAATLLIPGQVYTIRQMLVEMDSTTLEFWEFPGEKFNSVQFSAWPDHAPEFIEGVD